MPVIFTSGVAFAFIFLIMTEERHWKIEQQGFDIFREREMESVFCQGNGYLGSRGFSTPCIPSSYSDLLISGMYDRKAAAWPYSETEILSGDERGSALSEIVSFPSPFRTYLEIQEKPVFPGGPETLQHERVLDLKSGLFYQKFVFRLNSFRSLNFRTLRCVSLKNPHLLLQEIQLSENQDSMTRIDQAREKSAIELNFAMVDGDFELRHPHLKILKPETMESDSQLGMIQSCVFLTRNSGEKVQFLVKGLVTSNLRSEILQLGHLRNRFELAPGEVLRVFRWIVVGTEKNEFTTSFDDHLKENHEEWRQFWQVSDIQFEGNVELQLHQRFNLYQLRIAADTPTLNPLDRSESCYSIPARGLSGRAYEGHIFWDADIFIAPFFLFTEPELAKRMLCYRYRTLSGARERAKKMGYQGACYAWESTVSGEDVTPRAILLKGSGVKIPIFTGSQQLHITADVAYFVWKYWVATRDDEFLHQKGIEILFETARFWASRVQEMDHEFHLLKVVGPDEYHHDVDDNAYTNWMVKFNLEKAAWAMQWQEGSLSSEGSRWKEISERMYFPMRSDGVIEQFSGFFGLRDFELKRDELFKPPIDRLFEWEQVNQLKLIKQADVLMIFYLFPGVFPLQVVDANYRYYSRMTDHASSLSAPVYAAIAAQVGRRDEAEYYWKKSILLDLKNLMNNTSLGIHVGCIGAAWQTLVFHILGIQMSESGPLIPDRAWERLPPGCQKLRLNLRFRGKEFPIEIANVKETLE